MSDVAIDVNNDTVELDEDLSDFGVSIDDNGEQPTATVSVDKLVANFEATATVVPDEDVADCGCGDEDPERGGEEQTQRCWKFNDEETEHGVTLPVDADFEVKTSRDFIQVNFYEKDIVESTKYFEQLEGHTYDSGTYATSMKLVER